MADEAAEREELARVVTGVMDADGLGRPPMLGLKIADAVLAHLRARGWHVGCVPHSPSAQQLNNQRDQIMELQARAESAERALEAYKAIIVIHPHAWLARESSAPLPVPTTEGVNEVLDRMAILQGQLREALAALTTARLEHAQLVGEWERYREAVIGAQTALRHVSVTSSRYRSHQGACQARCTCDALTDDKLVKNEINRVIQPALLAIDAALTPPSPVKG